jgi:uncharacterized membrane protein YdfJ with MMPL/SSD domain
MSILQSPHPFASPIPSLSSIPPEDEESPAWLDDPLFQEQETPLDTSFWKTMPWASSPQRLKPVPRRLAPNESRLAAVWNEAIAYSKVPVLVVCVCLLWPLGVWSFHEFTHSTDSTFHPLPGSISADAQAAFANAYPNDWSDPMHPTFLLILESAKNVSLVDQPSESYNATKVFCEGLQHTINTTCWKTAWDDDCATEEWVKLSSYYTFHDVQLQYLAQSLTASRGRTMLIEIQYLLPDNATHHRERINQLMEVLESYGEANANDLFNVSYTGIKWFQADLMKATQSDLAKMDAIVLPLALILVGVVLPRANAGFVWIIPLVTMITTVCSWSIIMRFFAKTMQITQFTPSIMMSLTLGMGIDYTLFLLSRYFEIKNDKSMAIRHMIQHGGHVVILSGLTLMCTFLGLVFLPLQMLRAVGIGAAVAIGSALLVNLTVVPALLHTRLGNWIVSKRSDEGGSLIHTPEAPPASIWYRLSKHLLHPYKSVIIMLVIVQVLLPVARYAGDISSSISFDLLLPSAAPSLVSFHSLSKKVGAGRMAPFRILFDGAEANITVTSELGFDIMHRVIDEFIAIDSAEDNGITHIATGFDEVQPMVDALMDTLGMSIKAKQELKEQEENGTMCLDSVPISAQYAGIAVLKNKAIPHSLYMSAKYCAKIKPHCPVEALHTLDFIDTLATSKDAYATYVNVILSVDPFSDQGVAWLSSARATLQRLKDGGALSGVNVYIQGSAAIAKDAVDSVLSSFPTVIGVTMAVVFVLMGCFFRSVVAPLRSIVSISLTLSFVFGLVVLVYQHGILDWTGVSSWVSVENEVSWLVPVMAFSIIVGLSLDYDVFLVSRILEYRTQEGYGHKSSIAAGLHATGGIITAAGLIMAIAFGGLMLSSSPVLYQWSFMITTAVLLDTFVIRTLVVPIVTGWTGRYSWWPQFIPPTRVDLPGFDEEERLPLDGVDSGPLLPSTP